MFSQRNVMRFAAGMTALFFAGASAERAFVTNGYFTFGDPDARTASIALADFDGDGDLDAFTANGRHWAQQDYVYFNNGDGRMLAAIPVGEMLATAYKPAVVDFDGDGDVDIISLRDRTPSGLFINNGKGRFRHAYDFGVSGPARSASVDDFDKNGRLDVIIAQRSGRNYVVFNVGRGNERLVYIDQETQSVRGDIADFNGDGFNDAAFANIDASGSYVMLNDGAGLFEDAIWLGPETAGSIEIVAADVNQDGCKDIILGSWDRANRYLLNDCRGGFSAPAAYGLEEERTFGVAAADLNGDGRIDIAVANYGQPNAIYFMEADGSFRRVELPEDAEAFTYGVSIGDLNGDGALDVVFANSGAMNRIYLNVDPADADAALRR